MHGYVVVISTVIRDSSTSQVFLKEHGRGLYSNLSHFYSSSLPLYLLGAVNGVVFSSTSYGIFTRDQKVDSSSGIAMLKWIDGWIDG
jgi:hypothetical protein